MLPGQGAFDIQMKLLFASDLHGSAYWTDLLIKKFLAGNYQHLVLLGDILYHGPRNDLPREYNPKAVVSLLSAVADRIICVRGNCDAEVDQIVLPFDISSDYALVYDDAYDIVMHLYHGHNHEPKAAHGEFIISGHTHIPLANDEQGVMHLNPGSVSIPKNGSPNSYMAYENGHFTICDFENNTIMEAGK